MNTQELNDLFDYGYSIYQDKEYFKFSIDSILLAEFVSLKKGQKKLLDMCSGNAPIPMILHQKYKNLDITGVEIQKEIYDLGKKSLDYNNIVDINYINDDVKNLKEIYKKNKFDIITCNPPYFKVEGNNLVNDNNIKAIARHEIKITLEQVIETASKLIDYNGYFYLVHKTERIADIIVLLNKFDFGVKRINFIYDNKDAQSCFVLIESIYKGKNYVKIDKPKYLNEYTSYKNIFGE